MKPTTLVSFINGNKKNKQLSQNMNSDSILQHSLNITLISHSIKWVKDKRFKAKPEQSWSITGSCVNDILEVICGAGVWLTSSMACSRSSCSCSISRCLCSSSSWRLMYSCQSKRSKAASVVSGASKILCPALHPVCRFHFWFFLLRFLSCPAGITICKSYGDI